MLLHSGEPDPMTPPHDRTLTGIFLMVVFCVLAPLLDASSKLATDTIPVGQITAARFVVQGACMLPLAMIMRLNWAVSPKMLAMIGLRAVSLMLSTYCFVAGVQVMPIADALAIVFVMPFILMILGKLVFGNAVGPRRIAASIVGFGGALLVIQPSLANYGLVALFPLGCACFFAVYELVTQAMADGIHPVTLQLHTSLAGCLVSVPLIWAFNGSGLVELDPVMPQGLAWVWLFGVGFWAAVSHLSMTIAAIRPRFDPRTAALSGNRASGDPGLPDLGRLSQSDDLGRNCSHRLVRSLHHPPRAVDSSPKARRPAGSAVRGNMTSILSASNRN